MEPIDLSKIKTYPISIRKNIVTLKDIADPEALCSLFENKELVSVAEDIVAARTEGRPVIWMMGAHVIKCGLSLIVIDLMKHGIITHLASNGAAAIHDFEIALIGETSEDVATSIEDGTFGMAEETGLLTNTAVQRGVQDGLGFGESLGRMIAEDERFKFKSYSVLYNAYELGIPFTVHIAIGTDIIHQHPRCNFATLGEATGRDFKKFIAAVSQLEGGVFLNFGSAVIGPEVFLKALSISRNLGFKVDRFTTANFDIKPIEDYWRSRKKDEPDYYYRPLKNIVLRPPSRGGKGFHITGDHVVTIPNLRRLIIKKLEEKSITSFPEPKPENKSARSQKLELYHIECAIKNVIDRFIEQNPDLSYAVNDLIRAYTIIKLCFDSGGTLFICGNGGSFADSLHIATELMKSFKIKRIVPEFIKKKFFALPNGETIANSLEEGLRAIVLGANHSLFSAVENDNPVRNMALAQELYVLARTGDVFLCISTSGSSKNILNAAVTAKALGLPIILLTGKGNGNISEIADIVVKAPSSDTAEIQQMHSKLYHLLCEMLEISKYGLRP
ncbi:MAG: SIS domain-containing protein [Thermoproteota archaeon]